MQIRHILKTYNKQGFFLVKASVCVLCFHFLFKEVSSLDIHFILGLTSTNWGIIALVILAMLINQGLEAWRWQVSVPREHMDLKMALARVLSGQLFNWVLPLTIGDFVGRFVQVQRRGEVALAVAYNRLFMLLITFSYGVCSILFFFKYLGLILLLVLLVLSVGFGFLFVMYLGSGFHLPKPRLVKVFCISVIRYVVFTGQLMVLIYAFNDHLSGFTIFFGVGWIFFFRSVIPSLFGGLGVRELSAIYFFESLVDDVELVILPCVILWLINTIFPSLMGAVPVLKHHRHRRFR